MNNSSADVLEFCLAKAGQVNEDSRTFLAVLILLFSLIGIFTNSALLTVFIIHWKSSFGSQHFTHFVINMIISGLLYSATNLWVSVPCTFNECHFMRSDQLMIILSTPNTLAHWGYLLSAAALTIYRFGIFVSKCFAYKTTWIRILLISPWVLTAIITFGTTAMGCYKRYNRHSLGYTYNCSECNIAFGISFIDVNFYGGQAIPILMICAYIIILVCIYRGRKRGVATQRESRVDAKLALQFTVICCSQYLTAFLFFIVPKASKGAVWGVLTMNTIGLNLFFRDYCGGFAYPISFRSHQCLSESNGLTPLQ
ncbi:unnamed protein product [Haemonchus placei]|uniref:G_PROTEIN_RECEP_F1_2 domain-containing protein n=1 Tax=Haemonchus placei TaxID=6290 RepID=A0A0N4X0C9_HAEPC|nr:unnamed protein product [Haemonchus placei]